MCRLRGDKQWYKVLETEVVEKIAEEFANRTEFANKTKEEIANIWDDTNWTQARTHNARISSLFMFLFIFSFSVMPESKAFVFSFEVAIIGTIYGLWEVAAYYTSDEPGRTFYHFDFVLFSILLGVHVLAI